MSAMRWTTSITGMKVCLLPFCAVIAMCGGCASSRHAHIQVVEMKEVQSMHFVGEIHGFSGWYGVFAARGHANARAEALGQAADLGATHVVLEPQVPHYGGTEVHGKAYKSAP
jgi:hypothetical protein